MSDKSLPLQKVEQAKGRPLLHWVGKHPLEGVEFYPAQEKEVYGDKNAKDFNKLFWGDNLQVLSHLLKEYRGKVDLIYIDPPFDSAADYVKRVKVRGEKMEGAQQGLLEEKQYTDIWEKDEYLQFMYERLMLMRELLSETGSIYLQCDYRRNHYLRLIMDEVFGEDNLLNEVIWGYRIQGIAQKFWARKHNTLLYYRKTNKYTFNAEKERIYYDKPFIDTKQDENGRYYADVFVRDVWDGDYTKPFISGSKEYLGYPTQKPEGLLRRIIQASSNEGDLVADFFVGSGTTCAVAQKLGRRWIGCDINLGALQTSTKRLNKISAVQQKEMKEKLAEGFKGSLGFKVLNVNDYDIFKNELEAKEIVMEMYGVEPVKRTYFEGILDKSFVKVMPLNRVLNKVDIRTLLKTISDKMDTFTVKAKSKSGEPVYEESVLVICSGMELDVSDFLKKENKTGVKVEVRDILTDKKNLIFKQKPEARIAVSAKGKKLSVELKDFYSPILMRKLEIENEKVLKKADRAKVGDFKQIIDSVAIDVDYDGKLFNAEQMDLPEKGDIIAAKYEWEYPKAGKYRVAVRVIDVLGEEYFETFEVSA